ncbi:hypothetical protein NM688_g8007 [Phlebia brevispora]|uniref:Uncharacterized protein n=1 Tax=Phlebia brevispora TaxID=194682 RepID=A0ACC1RYT2_9APHY|nr:hypothetical protein NM688_g8007 [Phlebia brevispora]
MPPSRNPYRRFVELAGSGPDSDKPVGPLVQAFRVVFWRIGPTIAFLGMCWMGWAEWTMPVYPPPPPRYSRQKALPVVAQSRLPMSTGPSWDDRVARVKAAFVSAYDAYENLAHPHDELLPLSRGAKDPWGASVVDGLDGLSNRSLEHIMDLEFNESEFVQFFETVIRYLGGLLSAYALTGNVVLLSRANKLGKQLLPVFSSAHGLPSFAVNVGTWSTAALHISLDAQNTLMRYDAVVVTSVAAEY